MAETESERCALCGWQHPPEAVCVPSGLGLYLSLYNEKSRFRRENERLRKAMADALGHLRTAGLYLQMADGELGE